MSVQVRNPHSVLAALEVRPRDVIQITVPPALAAAPERASPSDAWAKVVKLARELKIPVNSGSKKPAQHSRPGGRPSDEGGRASVTEAILKEKASIPVESLFAHAREKAEGKGLWLALDSLQDPQNIGAIFRAAAFFGVQGILLTQERSAPLTGTVYDVSSGGVEHVPFTLQVNLQQAFEVAKEAGLWILGTSEHAQDSLKNIERDRPWLVVLGNEEKGIRRLTEESCDLLCRIPGHGKVTSLNVSVAAGILISHFS